MLFLNKLSIKSRMMALLLGVSLGSLLIAGLLSWLRFRSTFTTQTFDRLTSVRASKGNQIESYMRILRNHVETLSEDRMVVSAMVNFNSAFKELQNEVISSETAQKIENYYTQEFFPRLSENIQGEQVFANYRPTTQAGLYLQDLYLAGNPSPVGEKDELTDAKDGSQYSSVHQKYHPLFRNLIQKFGYYDLFLVDFETGEIIYSVYKETDYATSLDLGPYRRSNLASAIEKVRDNPGQRFVQVVDFKPYVPSYGAPAAFFAAPIYNGPHIVGILAVQLPVDNINNVMTGNQNWEKNGLGKTGEVYLVGADLLMRSISRFLIQDPEGYEADLHDAGISSQTIDLIKRLNTSILLQPVETEAARSAITGESGTTIVDDYRGVRVLSSFSRLNIEGLEWGILAEIDRAEAFEPLDTLQVYLIILAAILILAITFISNLAAQIFVKPIETLSQAARQVTEGDRDVAVNLNTEDEFGELGRAIEGMARDLRTQTTLVARKKEENKALLLNLLPDRVVERVQQGETQIVDSIAQATVLFVRLGGLAKASQHLSSAEVDTILNRLVDEFDQKAEQLGLERQNTISPTYLAICGLSKAYLDSSERTMKLALEMLEILQGANQEFDLELSLHGGIDCGSLEGGIVGSKKFVYKLWGETISTVTQLSYRATANNILVTQSVRDRLEEQYLFARYQPIEIEDVGELPTWSLITPVSTFSQQASLVQTSLTQLLPQIESTAKLFYERLFEMAPEIRPLFDEDISVQQRKFASTLQIAVNGLSNLDKLLPVIQDLGRQYGSDGVEEKHYQTVGEVLLWALQQTLGDNFTPSIKKAWVNTYTLLSGAMREASLDSDTDFDKDHLEEERVEREPSLTVEATEA